MPIPLNLLLVVLNAAPVASGDPGARAPADAAAPCGETLSPPVRAAWDGVGGAEGRLGCPTEAESRAATSLRGTSATETRFEGGAIIRHLSGPLAGQAFAVTACYRLFVRYGASSGWLGQPISPAMNTPDGQRQKFEGGALMYLRATDTCDDERS